MNTNRTFKVIGGTVKKFNRNHLTKVIAQERLPGLAGRPRQSPENSGDSTFGDLDAEHLQHAVNPGCAPERIGRNHPLDRRRISTAIAGRPRWRWFTLDRRAQNLRNRSRCQRTTVSARTYTREARQPVHSRDSPTQNNLSKEVNMGRFRFRWKAAS